MEWISGGKLVSHEWDCEEWKAGLAVTDLGSGIPWWLVKGGLGEVYAQNTVTDCLKWKLFIIFMGILKHAVIIFLSGQKAVEMLSKAPKTNNGLPCFRYGALQLVIQTIDPLGEGKW